jgi:hypothetical protein
MEGKPKVAIRLALAFVLMLARVSHADEVTEWNLTLFRSALMTNPASSPLVMSRIGAIVSAAVFDAVNDGRYAPIHVVPAAPAGASRRAAAVQAAYASILALYPTATYPSLKSALDLKRASSLASISAYESPASVASGIAWGQTVADQIVAWRSTDGFTTPPPAFVDGTLPGEWRRTSPTAPIGLQFPYMTPWTLTSQAQFHPAGPPALPSALYAAEFNETKSLGSATSTLRTTDQTTYAMFWNSTTASALWNDVAVSLLEKRGGSHESHDRDHHSLLRNARVLALLNLAIADAAIACWEAKYTYLFWRPITAIPLADTDGNAATLSDAAWVPLLTTPNHPEYPSGHSTLSGAAATVLARFFGRRARFTMESDLLLGVTRSFRSFSEALDEVANARIVAGIHFRTACTDGRAIGTAVASQVLSTAALPVGGDDDDD